MENLNMSLTEFRKKHNLEASELSKLTGLSVNYIQNNGYKNINDFPKNSKHSFYLVNKIIELKKENELLRKLIR